MTLVADRALADLDTARLERARWFAGKGRGVAGTHLVDALPVPGTERGYLLIVDVAYGDGGGDRYLLPSFVSPKGRLWEPEPGEGFWLALAEALRQGGRLPGIHGAFDLRPGPLLTDLGAALHGERTLGVDQSNTSLVLGERLVLKCYRRLEPGEHPEVVLGRALTERIPFAHVPAFAGSIHYLSTDGSETAVALLQQYLPDAEDGWEGIIGRLTRAIAARPGSVDLDQATDEIAEAGTVMAGLHVALAYAFGTHPASAGELAAWRIAAEAQLDEALQLLAGEARDELAALGPRILQAFAAFEHVDPPPLARIHGDLHYAQFIRSPAGVFVVDFEGEPTRSLAVRNQPSSPLRDVACLIRSLDHIARTAELRCRGVPASGLAVDAWIDRATNRCLEAYAAAIEGSPLTLDPVLLRAFEIEKETYEFVYAARFLPSWLYAPRLGMRWLFRHG
jgi:trehalose synthase-fused probable maltokinase